jgi:hypothetical protein
LDKNDFTTVRNPRIGRKRDFSNIRLDMRCDLLSSGTVTEGEPVRALDRGTLPNYIFIVPLEPTGVPRTGHYTWDDKQ